MVSLGGQVAVRARVMHCGLRVKPATEDWSIDMIRTLFAVSVIGVSLCGSAALAEPAKRDPEQILQDYYAVELVRPDPSRMKDEAYVKQNREQFFDALKKRADFAKELYRADPNHPEAMRLMQERMQTLFRTGQADVALKEIDELITKTDDATVKAELTFAKIQGMVQFAQKPPQELLKATEKFVAAYPNDPRGAMLLSATADRLSDSPEQAVALYQRVVEKYPDAPAARGAKGKLRQAEGIGKPFELSFTDAVSGAPVSIADLKGKVVVIDFWATWCGPCVADMPHMKEIYAKYKNEGVEFIGVSLDQPEAKGGLTALKNFVSENQITWPQYYQGNYWQSEFSSSWGINSIPAVFVIDQRGNLYSADAHGKIEQLIDKLLKSAASGT